MAKFEKTVIRPGKGIVIEATVEKDGAQASCTVTIEVSATGREAPT